MPKKIQAQKTLPTHLIAPYKNYGPPYAILPGLKNTNAQNPLNAHSKNLNALSAIREFWVWLENA